MCVLAAIVSILTRSDKLGPLISVMIGVGTIASVAGAIGLPLFAYRKVATINRWLLFFVLLLAAPILIFLTSMLLLGLVAGSG
jgi:hypothetical protein